MTVLGPEGELPAGAIRIPSGEDIASEAMREAIIRAAMGEGAPEPTKRKRHLDAPVPDPEADEVIDLGPYCVECREDTTGQEGRTVATQASAKVSQGEEGEEVTSVLLKGFKCEDCQPFESPLIEDALNALADATRRDPGEIRLKMRQAGVETIWAKWMGPMLEEMETALGLDVE